MTTFTNWQPKSGWLFLLPSRKSNMAGAIILPESHIKETDQGICFKSSALFGEDKEFLNLECYFAQHTQFTVKDSETGYEFYVLEATKVIMTRIPPNEVLTFSRKKPGDDSISFQTTENSKKKE